MSSKEKILSEVITLCLSCEKKAAELYERFSTESKLEELKQFWHEMAEEENIHLSFWGSLLKLSEEGLLPNIFDDPETTKTELGKTTDKIGALCQSYDDNPSVFNMFLLSYRMEFYLLNPAFEMLFHYIKIISGNRNPEDEYQEHLLSFIEMFGKFATITPELEMLGETLQALWKENRKLASQCFLDDLTKVCNRRGFFQTITPLLHMAKRNEKPIGILMADVDNFKSVNDNFGHQKGDEVLKGVGGVIKSRIRASDIAGRYGGEEFVALITDVNAKELATIAEDIRSRVENATFGGIPSISISIGIAVGSIIGDVDKDMLSLLKKADDCLYHAKTTGKNRVVSFC